jgi:hypothetical protein
MRWVGCKVLESERVEDTGGWLHRIRFEGGVRWHASLLTNFDTWHSKRARCPAVYQRA